MDNIEICGENGAWYKVKLLKNWARVHRRRVRRGDSPRDSVIEAHFSPENFFHRKLVGNEKKMEKLLPEGEILRNSYQIGVTVTQRAYRFACESIDEVNSEFHQNRKKSMQS